MMGLVALAFSALAQNAEVARFNSIHGEVLQYEDAQGISSLAFSKKGVKVALPREWKNVSVDQVLDLKGQTGILMSHTDGLCESRTSLLVVTQRVIRGPYNLGDCEDVMAYQKSEDGRSLIGIRADKANGKAWVYSSDDESFRGPVAIKLPESMAALVPKEDAPKQRPAARQTAAAKVEAPSPRPAPEPAPMSATVPPATTLPRQVKPSATLVEIARPSAEAGGTLSSSDASKVVAEAKKTTAPQRPKIMINL